MANRQQELNQALESMHFGFRAMTYQPDQRLAKLGLARIHHRLLYFIGRNPDCSINELLQIMRITKQYLHQPLKKLLDLGYVKQKTDASDRRPAHQAPATFGKRQETGVRTERGSAATLCRYFQTGGSGGRKALAPGDGFTQRGNRILAAVPQARLPPSSTRG
jgi:hypothetical protein